MTEELKHRSTIFLLEADDETRPVLKSNLQRYGYRVIVALDEEDALERAEEGGVRADLVLVDVVGTTPEDALQVARRIRTFVHRNGQTPLVVMAEKYGADVEGTDVCVGDNEWITYLEEPSQLKNLLARLVNELSMQDAAET